MPEGWGDFLVAETGASAALAGLLFVGLSLNLERILQYPALPNRAFTALVLLMTVLVTSSLMLLPGQGRTAVGIEILVITAVLWAWGTRSDVLEYRDKHYYALASFAIDATLFQIAVLPYLIGAILILAGGPAGFYVVAASIILSFIKAVVDAWILLVEIKR
jgi:modulator of FtsH protease